MRTVIELLSYPFLSRALLVGTLVALCAALLGVSLVLKRTSMIGDGLSHVSFGALAIAAAFGWAPLAVCIPVTVLAAFLILWLSSHTRIKGDAAIALFSTAAMAVGVIVVALSTGMTTDVYNYMFGSVLAVRAEDMPLSLALCGVVLVLFFLFYRRIFTVTFDENFSRASLPGASLTDALIAALTAIVIVLGMRMMGALLISSLIIFPALTAMRVCRSYKSVTATAALLSVFSFLVGLIASYLLNTPVGATVVAVDAILFGIFAAFGAIFHRNA